MVEQRIFANVQKQAHPDIDRNCSLFLRNDGLRVKNHDKPFLLYVGSLIIQRSWKVNPAFFLRFTDIKLASSVTTTRGRTGETHFSASENERTAGRE